MGEKGEDEIVSLNPADDGIVCAYCETIYNVKNYDDDIVLLCDYCGYLLVNGEITEEDIRNKAQFRWEWEIMQRGC